MNPPDVVNGDDEQFTLLLARYSEAMMGGDADPKTDAALSPELRQRLQRDLDCLRRLQHFRIPSDLRTIPYGESAPCTVVLPAGITLHDGAAGGQVGRFRLLRTLGHGGGGIVFLAFDPVLRRQAALKIPHLYSLLDPELRQRFLREARAAARLNHPNLLSVYEAGEADGLCYIVSAHCPGGSLDDWLARRSTPAPARPAAEAVAELADAVAYIHGHGIYHRDIKPSNILLDVREAQRGGELHFTPRLTDFGLAKVQDEHTEVTRSGVLLGTAPYMSPEQASGRSHDIGPRTDVYGLGTVLYEMLTGRPPFKGASNAATLEQVLFDEPAPPRRLRPKLPRYLDTICLKCLEKAPERRYAGAAELAADLRRFLAGEPIQARPAGAAERLGKWSRRHPWATAFGCLGCLAVLALLIGGFWLHSFKQEHHAKLEAAASRHEEGREAIRRKERLIRQYRYADDIKLAARLLDDRRLDEMREHLVGHSYFEDKDDLRGFEWHYLCGQARTVRCRMQSPDSTLYCAAFSADGKTCATGHQDGVLRIWDSANGRLLRVLPGHKRPVYSLAYSRDGRYLISGGGENGNRRSESEIYLWDAATLELRNTFPTLRGAVNSLAFSPDSRSVAAAVSDSTVEVWSLSSEMPRLCTIPLAAAAFTVAFLPDSTTLAAGHVDGKMSLCDTTNGKVLDSWEGHQHVVRSVACSTANASLVSGGHDHTVRLWKGKAKAGEYRHESEVWSVAVSPDARTVASISRDGIVKLWDVNNQRERFLMAIPSGSGRVTAFSPNGKTLAVGSEEGQLWMCDVSHSTEAISWLGHQLGGKPREAWAVAFSPDGKTLASAGDDYAVRLWDPATGRELAALNGHRSLVTSLAFSPDGKWLASASFDLDAPIKLWDAVTGVEIATLVGHTRPVDCLAFSPDSKTLATGGRDDTVRLWDLASRQERDRLSVAQVESLAFTPDGRELLLASGKQTAFLWDLEERKIRLDLSLHPRNHVAVAVAPEGKTIVSGDSTGKLRFWDAETGDMRTGKTHHAAAVNCLAFSPDGQTVASASFDRTIKLWQTATGRELLTLSKCADWVRWVAFSSDGKMLAAAGHDGLLTIYRADRFEPRK